MQKKNDFIERIHREVAIGSYISRFVKLTKHGRYYKGLCPFHNEKTPSFTVSPDKGVYHCFGCHKSGDIIQFVREFENVEFLPALEILSKFSGIPLQSKSQIESGQSEEKTKLYLLNKKVSEYYFNNLRSSGGKEAYEYLKSRGIEESIFDQFQLGYSFLGFDNLKRDILKSEEEIRLGSKLGLLKERPNQKGSYYDFFRDRVMFPIIDISGEVAGFGGRIIRQAEEAKYVNSPASLVYDKGKILYNLNNASSSIRKSRKVVLVEGYLDVLGLVSKGIENTVASLGTSVTESQVRHLKNYADVLILMMDGDLAGRKAAYRSSLICLKEGLELRVSVLDEKIDPFDFSRQKNPTEIQNKIDSAISASDFLIGETIGKARSNSTPDEKKYAVGQLFELVKVLEKKTDREAYLEEGARRLGLSMSSVLSDFSTTVGENFQVSKTDNRTTVSVPKKRTSSNSAIICEKKIVSMLILHNELLSESRELNEIEFLDEDCSILWDYIYTQFINNEEVSPRSVLSSELPEFVKNSIAPFLIEKEEVPDFENYRSILNELIHRQKIFFIDDEIRKLDEARKMSQIDEMQYLSDLSFYKTEKEKHLDYIRKLSLSTA
ncbi:MAG: DNA primase [Leptospiraceae bacterium]|nr:DNA primase [Leptospiraceae bacterium]MCK6381436.1 DNA primase [Leptospiraceae bacterium]NUM41255.1 DNA primase [Leptospiraceae bacterium]